MRECLFKMVGETIAICNVPDFEALPNQPVKPLKITLYL